MASIALTIAGSDSGGGAGIQADLKSFSALGVYGASVITAVTAQNTKTVSAIHAIPTAIVSAQIKTVLEDLDVKAIKIGMLATSEIIAVVAEALAEFEGKIVLDPVMVAKSGDALLDESSISALLQHLVPRAALLTPNLPEAAKLLEASPATSLVEMLAQGHALCGKGAVAVLMKGGHGQGETCVDLLVTSQQHWRFEAPRLATRNTHGTGCSLSSAIAAELAKGKTLHEAVARAHGWLHEAIKQADGLNIGHGHGPVHHFHEWWP
ncbi:MAG: bifunctional hydroxymethylpyrimidine kinase/phosphomethylpyrimidine kinase [Pseudomonadota bacterium]|nr:bifunctional hydroxymethylpyrimidine kinase/phosphomethylpyrimidine kinase [Pseudomonadota bacterium]